MKQLSEATVMQEPVVGQFELGLERLSRRVHAKGA